MPRILVLNRGNFTIVAALSSLGLLGLGTVLGGEVSEATGAVDPTAGIQQTIDLSGVEFRFTVVEVNKTKERVLEISNLSDATFEATLTIEGEGAVAFSVSESRLSIEAGGSLTVTITFAPREAIAYGATLVVTSTGEDAGKLTFPLSGTGSVDEPWVCVGDFDYDCDLDFDDFFLFADQFGTTPASPNWDPTYSLDGDDDVDFDDFFLLADNFTGSRKKPNRKLANPG